MLKKILSLTMALCMLVPAVWVLADDTVTESPYMKEATAAEKEAGILGYALSKDFEDGVVGDRVRYMVAGTVEALDGEALSSKAAVTYYNAKLTSALQSAINFKSATTYNYVMLETEFMIPDVSAEGEAPYAGGVASVGLGWTFVNDYGVPSTSTGAVTSTFNFTGNRGNEKGSISFNTADCSNTAATAKNLSYKDIDIAPDVWHKVEILADTKAKTLDLYLDGKLMVIGVMYGNYNADTTYSCSGLRSASISVAGGTTSTNYTAGQLIGNAAEFGIIRATEGATVEYNPYPVLWDDLNVMEVTPAFVGKKVESGYKAFFEGGRMYQNPTMLPLFSRIYAKDIPVTYTVDDTQEIVEKTGFKVKYAYGINNQTLTRPADDTIVNPITNENYRPQIAAQRQKWDYSGVFTVNYKKDAGETPDPNYDIDYTFDVNVLLRANVAATEVENIMANAMFFTETEEGVGAGLEVSNVGTEDYQATFFVCSYEDDKLTNIEAVPVTLKAGGAEVTFFSEVPTGENDVEVKAFMWGLKGLDPIRFGTYSLTE